MKKIISLLLLLFACGTFAAAQKVSGKVYFLNSQGEKEVGAFANVWWMEGKSAVESDENGNFTIRSLKGDNITLIAAYVGYRQDTVKLFENGVNLLPDKEIEFNLVPENELDGVTVLGRQQANFLSKTANIKTEVISAAGLCKMACCSLAESFESSASVSVGYSDAVTGAKQIKLLGLSGSYTQMLDETRPVMRGLASPFGLTYVPGQWLESIQIAKGPSSVVNGLEAITGQINVEHRKPTAENPLFVNLFTNTNLRTEANVASSLQLNEKWSTVMMGHYSKDNKIHDENGDMFRDDPLTEQFNFDNRWLYFNPNGTQVRFGVKFMNDTRVGGHKDYKEGMNDREFGLGEAYDSGIWGNEIHNTGIGGFFKLGIPLNEDQSKNIAVVADYSYYDMESSYGLKDFGGYQNMGFFNAMYHQDINENHKYTLGLSGRFDDIHSSYVGYTPAVSVAPGVSGADIKKMMFNTDDKVIGAYAEYTYTLDDKISLVAGLRADYSSQFGWQVAPRASFKYSFTDRTVLRLTGGRGFRTPQVITDNLGVLSSGRDLEIAENLKAEDAWTFGGNFTQYFSIGDRESNYFSFDYFRTGFNHKVVYDWDADMDNVVVYDFRDATLGSNRAYTDTYQFDLSLEPVERFTAIATFRYSNAKISMKNKGLVDAPMTSKYKAVLNLQYAMPMNKWMFDATAQLNGPCRLPQFMGGGESEVYPMFFAQVTKKFNMVDVYVGVENIAGYTQDNPILNANDAFGKNFNASMVWGPLMGRMFYIGMRYTMWK